MGYFVSRCVNVHSFADSSDSSQKIVALGTIQDEYLPPGPSTSEISSQELTEISSSNTCLVKCTVTNESKSSDSMKNSSKSSNSLNPTHFKHKLTDADKLVFLSSKTDTKPVKYYFQKGARETLYTFMRVSIYLAPILRIGRCRSLWMLHDIFW